MIKEKRKAKKLTQEQMAEKLGISLRQYIRIDHEEDMPRRDVLKKLINELAYRMKKLVIILIIYLRILPDLFHYSPFI